MDNIKCFMFLFQDETDTNHCIMTDDATPIFSVQHGYNGEVEGEDFNERHRIVSIDSIVLKDHPFPS